MDTIAGIIISLLIGITFFRLRHFTGKHTDDQIAHLSKSSSDIRFKIVNLLIKGTDPKDIDVVDEHDDGSDIDTSIDVNKCIKTKEYDTKLIRITLAPYLDNWTIQAITFIAVIGSFLFLMWLTLYSIDAKSYESEYSSLLIASVQIIAFLVLCIPLALLLSCCSLFPIHCIIRQDKLSVRSVNIAPIEQKLLTNVEKPKTPIFMPITYKIYKIGRLEIILHGIGMNHDGNTYPLIYAPRSILNLFGSDEISMVVNRLNNEVIKK